jgi:hypothetical protein
VNRRVVGASAAAFVAGYWIVDRGAQLVPDTAAYAAGHSRWSSSIAGVVGSSTGRLGVELLGVLGAGVVGYLLVRWSGDRLSLPLLVLLVLPPRAWAIASPDALGAAAAAIAYRMRRRGALLLPVALVHLEAALVLAAVLLLERRGVGRYLACAIAGAGTIVCVVLVGLVVGVSPDELQWRYLLPAALIAVAGRNPTRCKPRRGHASKGRGLCVAPYLDDVPPAGERSRGGLLALRPEHLAEVSVLPAARDRRGRNSTSTHRSRDRVPGAPLQLVRPSTAGGEAVGHSVRCPAHHPLTLVPALEIAEAATLQRHGLLSDHRMHPGDADSARE